MIFNLDYGRPRGSAGQVHKIMSMYREVEFNHSDDCIEAACGYANKTKEKCEVIKGESIYDDYHFMIRFLPSHNAFLVKRYLIYPRASDQFGTRYKTILDRYGSIEDFINNHSRLIIFF